MINCNQIEEAYIQKKSFSSIVMTTSMRIADLCHFESNRTASFKESKPILLSDRPGAVYRIQPFSSCLFEQGDLPVPKLFLLFFGNACLRKFNFQIVFWGTKRNVLSYELVFPIPKYISIY